MMTPAQLNIAVSDLSSRYNKGLGRLEGLRDDAARDQKALAENRRNVDRWELTRLLLTKTSEFAREQAVRQVEQLVTSALQAVFGDEGLSFRIAMGERGGQSTADFEVVSQFGELQIANDPSEARGGGIVDVVSMALRLAIHRLTRNEGVLVLDEPAKMVSEEYQAALAYFIREFAAKTKIRILMVTHSHTLADAGDLEYRTMKHGGVSYVNGPSNAEVATA